MRALVFHITKTSMYILQRAHISLYSKLIHTHNPHGERIANSVSVHALTAGCAVAAAAVYIQNDQSIKIHPHARVQLYAGERIRACLFIHIDRYTSLYTYTRRQNSNSNHIMEIKKK